MRGVHGKLEWEVEGLRVEVAGPGPTPAAPSEPGTFLSGDSELRARPWHVDSGSTGTLAATEPPPTWPIRSLSGELWRWVGCLAVTHPRLSPSSGP